MSLVLHGHPLSSYCHKLLIALYDTDTPFTFRHVDPSDPAEAERMRQLTPMGQMPALEDEARGIVLAETSVIIGWLARHFPDARRLLPEDPDAAIEAQVWDRFFDFNVSGAMQPIVNARLFMDKAAEPGVTAYATACLDRAYAAADQHLDGRDWLAGDFGLADCAATPALFYAGILHPFDAHPRLSAYFERLLARPSVIRVLDEARPVLGMFPFADRVPQRFR